MKNKNKIIILSIFTVVLILLTFVMIVNDSLEYAIITIALTVMLFTYLCTLVFKKDDELSNYKKKLKNILKTYDSVLVYSGDELVLENENIIIVKNFHDILIRTINYIFVKNIQVKNNHSIYYNRNYPQVQKTYYPYGCSLFRNNIRLYPLPQFHLMYIHYIHLILCNSRHHICPPDNQ